MEIKVPLWKSLTRYGCRIIQRLLECGPPDQVGGKDQTAPCWDGGNRGELMFQKGLCHLSIHIMTQKRRFFTSCLLVCSRSLHFWKIWWYKCFFIVVRGISPSTPQPNRKKHLKVKDLIDCLLEDAINICAHPYGNYVWTLRQETQMSETAPRFARKLLRKNLFQAPNVLCFFCLKKTTEGLKGSATPFFGSWNGLMWHLAWLIG